MIWLRAVGLRLLLAIGLGIALWVFVSYSENPDQQVQFEDLPVSAEGLAADLMIVDQRGLPNPILQTVTVSLEVDSVTRAGLQSNGIQAFVNLSSLEPGEHLVPVGLHVATQGRQPDVTGVVPSYLSVRLEREISRVVPLTVEVTGTVPFSFERGEPRVTVQGRSVTQAQVRGPQSRVERVTAVRALVDIDRLTANYNSSRPLEAIAQDGQVVAGIIVDPQSVNVQVPIVSSAGIKRVPVVPRVVGRPASGYIVTGVSVDPEFVTLTGSSGPLDSVQSVATFNLDIEGASKTFSGTVSLEEPAIARLSAGEATTATVTVQIAPVARTFQVTLPAAVQAINVGDGLSVSLNPQLVQLTLTGTAAQLAAFDTIHLQGTVNLRGLGTGTYTLAPVFTLPPGVTMVSAARVTVTLAPLPSPTPVVTPTEVLSPSPIPSPAPTEVLTPTATITPAATVSVQ